MRTSGYEFSLCVRIDVSSATGYEIRLATFEGIINNKRYLMKQFPKKPKARYLTTMYKVFISQRALALRTDRIFREYLKKYYSDEIFKRVPWWDILYWEFSCGACEGLHTTYEHRLAYEVTIPYNNRFLLYSMLRIPLKKRIEDSIQIDVIKKIKAGYTKKK